MTNRGYADWRSQPAGTGDASACTTGVGTCITRTGDWTSTTSGVDDYSTSSQAVAGGATVSSIAGTVWEDANNDGVLDAGEPGIGGVTVTLTGMDLLGNPVTATTTTGVCPNAPAPAMPCGTYRFDGLRPGTYQLTETQPAGYLDGTDVIGHFGDGIPKGTLSGNDRIIDIVLPVAASTTAVGYDFGEIKPSSLAGMVWGEHRTSENGAYDAGTDTPLGGVTITLTGTTDRGPIELTTTTDATGAYSFPNLRPGTYTVTETQPAGWAEGAAHVGVSASTPGAAAGPNVIGGIVLGTNENATAYDFHELERANVRIDKRVVGGAADGSVGLHTSFTWRITVTNDGPSPVTNVRVEDDLATIAERGLTVTGVTTRAGVTCSTWTQEPVAPVTRNLDCVIASIGIAPANTATIDLAVRADRVPEVANTPWPNTARITGVDQLGDDPSDNVSTSQVIVRDPELGVVKRGDVDRLFVGQHVTWTIRVTNSGPGTEPDARLTDSLPPQAMIISTSTDRGTCATGAVGLTTLECAFGEMKAGDVAQVQVVAVLPEAGTYRNVATIVGSDRDMSNQTSEHTVIVTVPGVADCTVEGSGRVEGTGAAGEVICGGGGDDVIVCGGGAGGEIILAGGGNDTIICDRTKCTPGAPPTIIAGTGNDVIRVTCPGAIINGGDGNDTIVLSGNAPGIAYGGAGNDVLIGGSGADVLCGNEGNDVIRGGGGNDLLDGGAGNDVLYGQAGNDRLYGGTGNDKLFGGPGHDRLYGGAGNDRLDGGTGNDLLFGERGNDVLIGGPGRDSAHGGDGNDVFFMRDRAPDRVIGGRGRDTLHRDRGIDRWAGIERVR